MAEEEEFCPLHPLELDELPLSLCKKIQAETSRYRLLQYMKDDRGEVREHAAANPNMPARMLEKIAFEMNMRDSFAQLGAATNPSLSVGGAQWLAGVNNPTIRLKVFQHHYARFPLETLYHATSDTYPPLLVFLASTEGFDDIIYLNLFRRSRMPQVREALALNPSIGEETHLRLQEDAEVRGLLLRNPVTPITEMLTVAEDAFLEALPYRRDEFSAWLAEHHPDMVGLPDGWVFRFLREHSPKAE